MRWSSRGMRLLLGTWLAGLVAACGTSPQPALESLHYSTVMVEHAEGHGTGTIVGPDLVLTADHVVTKEPLSVRFFEGQTMPGEIRWRSPSLDLALVRAEVAPLNRYRTRSRFPLPRR